MSFAHPDIEYIVQKQMAQQRTDNAALRRALGSFCRLTLRHCMGAFSHRSMYSKLHLQSVCFLTAFIRRSWRMLSNRPLMSNSTTQSYCQQRWRVTPTASRADLFGRYPYESGCKCLSISGSSASFTTFCAIRSATVGTPSMRSPPVFFGMATAFTGGGK